MAHTHDAPHEHGTEHAHHIIPPKTYYIVFAWLMVLLVITLAAAIPDLGHLNLPIAMAIALAKVYLIMAFFMHLKYNTRLIRFFALGSLMFLVIMFIFTYADYLSRPWFPQ